MDASQYKNYVLMLLFIKSISGTHAGQPIAPLVIPEGWLYRQGGAQRDGGGAASKCLRVPGAACRRAIATSSPMSCVTLRLPERTCGGSQAAHDATAIAAVAMGSLMRLGVTDSVPTLNTPAVSDQSR